MLVRYGCGGSLWGARRCSFDARREIPTWRIDVVVPLGGSNAGCHDVPMSLDQLRTVVAIADQGTVTAAAEKLHISQPPLSRQLADLEDELGIRLFERQPRGMRLMPAGEIFVAHARLILAAVDAAVVAVRPPSTSSP
jgi:hypothetical protein